MFRRLAPGALATVVTLAATIPVALALIPVALGATGARRASGAEAFYLTAKLAKTSGKGTFVSNGLVTDQGTFSGTFKPTGNPPTAVAGTNRLISKQGTITISFNGPELPAAPPPSRKAVPPIIVNFGNWSVTAATGAYASLVHAKGTFVATITASATVLHAGFYAH